MRMKPDVLEVSKKRGPVYAAIVEVWGERCPDYDPDCLCCMAWADYDRRGAAVQWRPISEAPKDELILVGPTKRMGICAAMNHSRDGWVTETCADWVPIYTPAHWMPLPPPPAGETSDE